MFQRHRVGWSGASLALIWQGMTAIIDPDPIPTRRRRPSFDRLNLACLVWAGLFAVVTAVLALVLR